MLCLNCNESIAALDWSCRDVPRVSSGWDMPRSAQRSFRHVGLDAPRCNYHGLFYIIRDIAASIVAVDWIGVLLAKRLLSY